MKEQRFKFLIRNKVDGYIVAGFNSADEAIKHLKIRNTASKILHGTEGDYELIEAF